MPFSMCVIDAVIVATTGEHTSVQFAGDVLACVCFTEVYSSLSFSLSG